MQLALERTPDLVAEVDTQENRPFTVGFAAETEKVLEYAEGKMSSKNLDMIVANDVSGDEAGFNSDRNAATILWNGGSREVELTSKGQLARILVEAIAARKV